MRVSWADYPHWQYGFRNERTPEKRKVISSTASRAGYRLVSVLSRSLSVTSGTCYWFEQFQIADSALEDRQVPVSRTAPISAIPVRSPFHGSDGCDWPGRPSVAGRVGSRRSRLRRVRDEEAAGSNPATPTGKRQVTEHIVTCRLHYTFPGVRFWEPVGSGLRTAQGTHGPSGYPSGIPRGLLQLPLRLSGRGRGCPAPSHTTGHAGPHPAVRQAVGLRRCQVWLRVFRPRRSQ